MKYLGKLLIRTTICLVGGGFIAEIIRTIVGETAYYLPFYIGGVVVMAILTARIKIKKYSKDDE